MNNVSRETNDPPQSSLLDSAFRASRFKVFGLDPLESHNKTRIIAIANQKGGVGKTTSTVNLAASLAYQNLKVLVIDLDPQGNATTALGLNKSELNHTIYEIFSHNAQLAELIQQSETIQNLDIAPTNIDLSGAEIELVSEPNRENILNTYLATLLKNNYYDYVFIDTPPSLGLLSINALVACNEVLIPIQCEYYALEGVSQLLSSISLIKENLNPHIKQVNALLTMYDARTKLSDQVVQEVESYFGHNVIKSVIPRNVKLSEAPGFSQTILQYDPGSTGAKSYVAASQQLHNLGE